MSDPARVARVTVRCACGWKSRRRSGTSGTCPRCRSRRPVEQPPVAATRQRRRVRLVIHVHQDEIDALAARSPTAWRDLIRQAIAAAAGLDAAAAERPEASA